VSEQQEERDARILALVAERKHSYAVIAEMCNTTRSAVGGVVFRDRHPQAARCKSPGARAANKMGHGWQAPTYVPEQTRRGRQKEATAT